MTKLSLIALMAFGTNLAFAGGSGNGGIGDGVRNVPNGDRHLAMGKMSISGGGVGIGRVDGGHGTNGLNGTGGTGNGPAFAARSMGGTGTGPRDNTGLRSPGDTIGPK